MSECKNQNSKFKKIEIEFEEDLSQINFTTCNIWRTLNMQRDEEEKKMKTPEYYDTHADKLLKDLKWCSSCEKIIALEEIDYGYDGSLTCGYCGSLIYDPPQIIGQYIMASYHWKDAYKRSNKLNDILHKEIEELKTKVKKINQILEDSIDHIKNQF